MNDDLKRDEQERGNAVESIVGSQEENEGSSGLSRRTFFMSVAGALGTLFFGADVKRTLADSKPLYVPGTLYVRSIDDNYIRVFNTLEDLPTSHAHGVYRPIGLIIRQTPSGYSPPPPPDNNVKRGSLATITVTLEKPWDPTDIITLTTLASRAELIDYTPGSASLGQETTQLHINMDPINLCGHSNVEVPIFTDSIYITLEFTITGADGTQKISFIKTFTVLANA